MKISNILAFLWCFFRHPITFYRNYLITPTIKFTYDTVQLYKTRTVRGISNVKEILFRGIIVAGVTSILVWLSVFMYLAFYYVYVPTISHERPVFLQFKPCENNKGICSFPSAHIQLTKRQQLLMYGQPYKIHLELEMPDNPNNQELGMFMVCADFRAQDGDLITSSCRSAMLAYKSVIMDTISKILFGPLLIVGGFEEKQRIHIELFADYEEHESTPVTDVYIEIQTKYIQLYSAKFFINAHFSGMRYFMFHWPLLSATIGITSNLCFIAAICLISWYQLIHSEEYRRYVQTSEGNTPTEFFKGSLDDDSSSSQYDEDVSLLNDPDVNNSKEYREERKILEDIKPVSIEQ